LNCGALAQKVARPHSGLLPQEKGRKKAVVRPTINDLEIFDGGISIKL
jgi:hypothetical protein